MKKNLSIVLVVLSIGLSGFVFQGCFSKNENTVQLTVPNVNLYCDSARTLANFAKTFYIKDDSPKVKLVLDRVIHVVKTSDHDVSNLIINTVDESIKEGLMPVEYRLLILGVISIIDNRFKMVDFNVDDVVLILTAASDGLDSSKVKAADVADFGW